MIMGTALNKKVITTKDGQLMVMLSIAVNESWHDKVTKERMEATEWFNIKLFSANARIAEEHLSNGDIVYAEGPIKTRKFVNKDGVETVSREPYIHKFDILRTRGAAPVNHPARVASSLDDDVPRAEFDDDAPY